MKQYKNPIAIAGGEEPYVCPQALVLNPYLSCSFNCVYCYAKWIQNIYNNWNKIRPADVSLVRRELEGSFNNKKNNPINKLIRQKIPFRCGNLTDPFQPIEEREGITYKVLKILKRYNYPIILNTKGVIQARDKYIEILKDSKVVVQETITTDNKDIANSLEPNTPDPKERIEAINKLAREGIKTQVRYSPVFPNLTDEPESLFSKLEVNDIICEFMRFSHNKKYKLEICKSLGYNYFKELVKNNYPLVKTKSWIKLAPNYIFDEYKRFKSLAKDYDLNFYVCCEERPELNRWKNCCGTEKYKGFENYMDWTLQTNGDLFNSEITFDEYIEESNGTCPYKEEFREYWNEGKLLGALTDLKFDKNKKTYYRWKNKKD